jgi:hypothetical protein
MHVQIEPLLLIQPEQQLPSVPPVQHPGPQLNGNVAPVGRQHCSPWQIWPDVQVEAQVPF